MRRAKFIQDLGELLVFGTGLWGFIAILSILLPIANVLAGILPLPSSITLLATTLAVIAAFFAFAYSFTEKSHILEFEMRRPFFRGEMINPRRDLLHNAATRFAWGFVSLGAYLALNAAYETPQGNTTEAAKWLIPVIEPLSAVFYATAFALITGAFGALAVMQHARLRIAEVRTGSVNLGTADETLAMQKRDSLATSPDGMDEAKQKN